MPSSSPEELEGGAAGHRHSGAHLPTAQRGSKGESCSSGEMSVTSPETAEREWGRAHSQNAKPGWGGGSGGEQVHMSSVIEMGVRSVHTV